MSQSAHTAFLIVDIQNPYLHPDVEGDGFSRLDIGGESLIQDLRKTAEILVPKMPVIYVVSEPDYLARTWRGWTPSHYLPGEHGKEQRGRYSVPQNFVPHDAHLVSKTESSAFHTDNLLDPLLKKMGIHTLVIAGLNTDVCVYETARDAAKAGYKTDIALNLCRDPATRADLLARETRLRAKMAREGVSNVGIVTLDHFPDLLPEEPKNPRAQTISRLQALRY
jgi:nicotinamidase-related amidase